MAKLSTDVFITRSGFHPKGLEYLKQHCRVKIWNGAGSDSLSFTQLAKEIQQSKILLCFVTDEIDENLLRANPYLLGVVNYGVGFNNIAVSSATRLGIPVTNTPGVLTEATADLTWALILAVARNIPQAHRYVVEGSFKSWKTDLFLGAEVGRGPENQAKTLGIIGFGRIGEAVARRARGFGMRIVAYSPNTAQKKKGAKFVEFLNLKQVLQQSDFLSLHCALNDKTRHLMGEKELKLMKKTAFLINTARGPIVDERALVKALRNGTIAGAGLDVYEDEPRLTPGLRKLENVVLLPHIGSASHETRAKMAMMAAENALALLHGKRAPNTVNKEAYEMEKYLRKINIIR